MKYCSLDGMLTRISGPNLSKLACDIAYNANDLVLTIAVPSKNTVPEPGGVVLMGVGVLGVAVQMRRRRRG